MQRETIETVYVGDPALADLPLAWWTTRDMSTLSHEQRAAATIYQFRRLTREERSAVYRATTDEQRAEWAFAAGVVAATGPSHSWARGHGLGFAAQADAVEEEFSPAEQIDVGAWIWAVSQLGKGSAPRLLLPPTSLLAWDARVCLSAAPSQE